MPEVGPPYSYVVAEEVTRQAHYVVAVAPLYHTTPAHIAASYGWLETIRLITRVARDYPQNSDYFINSVDRFGFTPFMVALYRGRVEIVQFLLSHYRENDIEMDGAELQHLQYAINVNLKLAAAIGGERVLQSLTTPSMEPRPIEIIHYSASTPTPNIMPSSMPSPLAELTGSFADGVLEYSI